MVVFSGLERLSEAQILNGGDDVKPNWFVAWPVDAGDWFEAVVADAPDSLRRFAPTDLHLTLAFLGPATSAQARDAWAEAIRQPPPAVEITFGPVEGFGNPRKPSAFAATIDQNRKVLCDALVERGSAILAAAGLPPERRGPRPHVTLARPNRRAPAGERAIGAMWARTATPTATLRLDTLALYTWSDDRKTTQFKIVEQLTLP